MSEVEIGIWVDGTQKWVNGVTRRTSCYDVIKALLRAQNLPSAESEITNYVIVERWRKVEKPLDHEQRILKVWKTWGQAIDEVRFTLRKSRGDDVSECETSSRTERRRRHKYRPSAHQGTPSKKPAKEEDRIEETMDRLMRLVLAQGETIQTQLKKLQERDTQIDTYEQQMHLLRVQSMGSDYLVHSYLKEPARVSLSTECKEDLTCEEKSNDSGVVADETMDTSDTQPKPKQEFSEVEELQAKTSLLEDMEKVLSEIIQHEENLLNLETLIAKNQKLEVEHLEEELVLLSNVHSKTVSNVRQNDQSLREVDTVLLQKKKSFEKLLEEDRKLDQETIKLQNQLEYIMHLPASAFYVPTKEERRPHQDKSTQFCQQITKEPPPPPLPTTSPPPLDDEDDSARASSCSSSPSRTPEKSQPVFVSHKIPSKDFDSPDSNSDTGLSSLHSSSDEGVYTLDTLV